MLGPATLVTVTISGEAKGVQTGADMLAAAVQELGYIPLTVVASSIDTGSTLYNAATFQWLHYQYKAVVTVSVPGDTYDDTDEVAQAVSGAFEDAAGSTPTAVQATAPRTVPTIDAPAGGSLLPDVGNFINTNVHGVLLIVVALIVLLVVTIGWGKNIGKIAGAVTM